MINYKFVRLIRIIKILNIFNDVVHLVISYRLVKTNTILRK